MGRFIMLVGVCLVIIGALITFRVPLSWVGNLPGDFSLHWGQTQIFIPLTTAVIFSLVLSVFMFLFARR